MQKAQGEISPLASTNTVNGKARSGGNAGKAVIYEDGTVVTRDSIVSNSTTLAETSADDDASTRGVVSSSSAPDVSSAGSSPDIADSITIPTIRISTESQRDGDLSPTTQEPGVNGEAKRNVPKEMGDTLEKPVQAAAGESADGAQEPPSPSSAQEPFSFSNKRLCERWLDNLFMVLYEVCALTSYMSSICLTLVPGSARVDNIQSRSGTLQNTACCLSQDWFRMGNPRGLRSSLAPQGRSEGSVPTMPRHSAIFSKAVVEAHGDVC
jgi:hypothetical protein